MTALDRQHDELAEAQDRANAAESILADVETLHQPAGRFPVYCREDNRLWPCPTTVALRIKA